MLRGLKLRVMAAHHDYVPSLPSSSSPALKFQVLAQQGRARTALMTLPHFTAETPMFMPVGTQGSVKGITCDQMLDLDCHVILGRSPTATVVQSGVSMIHLSERQISM